MSRIGKLPIAVPDGVSVEVNANHVKVTGPKGTLERTVPAQIAVKVDGSQVVCERPSDGRGNYTLGLREQIVFPEVDYDKIDKLRGLEVTVVTTAKTDDEARSLLTQMGMPFRKQDRQ